MKRWVTIAIGVCIAAAPAGAATVDLHGLLDVTASKGSPAVEQNWLNAQSNEFDSYRLRLFATAPVPGGFQAVAQVLFDEHQSAEPYGAYLQYTPQQARDVNVLAGKIPWIVGSYASRSTSDRKALVGTPLAYQYHTALRMDAVPLTVEQLLAARGRGQTGAWYDASNAAAQGMPIVYDARWDFGAVVVGSREKLRFAAGLANGAPGAPSSGADDNTGKSLLGRVGYAPIEGVEVGVSAAYGPYLSAKVVPALPAGSTANDYSQRLAMLDVAITEGPLQVNLEMAHNVWESPYVGNLRARAYYLEGKWSLPRNAFLAGRVDGMDFSDVVDSQNRSHPWDSNIMRVEAGVGYRINESAVAKLIGQRDAFTGAGKSALEAQGQRTRFNLVAAQLSLAF